MLNATKEVAGSSPSEGLRVVGSSCSTEAPDGVRTTDMTVNWAPKKGLVFFGLVATCLVVANIAGIVSFYYLGHSRLQLFNVDRDRNVPDVYAGLTLLLCAALLAIISTARKQEGGRDRRRWAGLALVLLLLSIDEAANVHERTAGPMMTALHVSGATSAYVWILPYVVLLVLLAVLYVPFFLALTGRMRSLIILAAVLYVSGAVGVELLGSYWAEHRGVTSPAYELITTLEWSLQTAGVLVLAYALMSYIVSELGSPGPHIGSSE
jgi:hypothetical protein